MANLQAPHSMSPRTEGTSEATGILLRIAAGVALAVVLFVVVLAAMPTVGVRATDRMERSVCGVCPQPIKRLPGGTWRHPDGQQLSDVCGPHIATPVVVEAVG